MGRNSKRLLALLLALAMVAAPLSSVSAEASAGMEEEKMSEELARDAEPGTGKEENSSGTEKEETGTETLNPADGTKEAEEEFEKETESDGQKTTEEKQEGIPSEDGGTDMEPGKRQDQGELKDPSEAGDKKELQDKTEIQDKTEEEGQEAENLKTPEQPGQETTDAEKNKAPEETGETEMDGGEKTESPVRILRAIDGTEYEQFQIRESSVRIDGNQAEITFITEDSAYDGILPENGNEGAKESVIRGAETEDGGLKFSFTVPAAGRIPVRLKDMETGSWCEEELVMEISGLEISGQGISETDAFSREEDAGETAEASAVLFAAAKPSDGVYDVAEVETGETMFRVVNCILTSDAGTLSAVVTLSGTGYDYLYMGTGADAAKASKDDWIPYVEDSEGKYTFVIPVPDLDTPVPLAAHSKKKDTWYDRTMTFKSAGMKRIVKEGIYQTTVESNNKMFKVVDCTLTSNGKTMSALITLSSDGYDYLYMGTKEAAANASKADWIPYGKDAEGKYTFVIPVSELDAPVVLAAHSKKKDEWYDRELTFHSTGMKRTAEAGSYRLAVDLVEGKMFRVTDCVLTCDGKTMSAVLTLSGTGYDYLYMGTAADAAKAAQPEWIRYVADADGAYTFTVPVEELDAPIAVAARSASKGTWGDKKLVFRSEGMEKVSGGNTPGGTTPGGTTPGGTTPGGNTPGGIGTGGNKPENTPGGTVPGSEGDTEVDNTADTESKYESDLSGSTKRVDSSTSLKDGVYKPDKFSWSGGTGRVSISCRKVTVTGGKAYATIVFSSDSYSYIKANGNKYYGIAGGGTSSFVIPVELNKNNTLLAMTTKMSASHEIQYTIYIYLAAAAKTEGVSEGQGGLSGDVLDEEAPEIIGLEYEKETKLEHAEYFKIYHYNDGITLLEIDLTKDTAREASSSEVGETEEKSEEENKVPETEEKPEETKVPEQEEAEYAAGEEAEENIRTTAEITAELYKGKVVKYLLVPEEAEIPVGLEQEVIVIPLSEVRAYAASGEALKIMDTLGALENVAAAGWEKEDCPVEKIVAAMEVGTGEKEAKVAFGGPYDEPDFKTLLSKQCSVALLPGEILPKMKEGAEATPEKQEESGSMAADRLSVEEQTEQFEMLTGQFAMLSIPVIVDRSADEKTELAKYEWIKVYGVLFGCEEEAEELFAEAVTAAEEKTADTEQ